ncbi:helicase-exonuclease AddAB subunit AddA [Ruminiclostridium herbifermentans]|uniref:ATP-dependent helicase/nuclease subunit A n=1 Tax=Ruminiclostridium herbifermentans TaxID=2488810 RepID=A0A4U7JN00_9FIRM|nr:helicase-exonuclease AddAB subunit AddA [Ruminiclostridium herbifermentans]QNU68566.1 helicase-exonuclease AddAB subunit AddA [Ruminiclostridium herbifermentans]
MSEMKWTKEQFSAITEKNCNLLVAAAAGAGKTAVLVERIIQKIIDEKNPIDIDALLVVTFTNAAATEMRERIGAAISKTIEENKASKNVRRQLALLNKASITTIHSFCLEVIRNNFQSIDIDPNFRILDETEATLLKIETLNELFEEIYEEEEEKNQDFIELLESFGSNRDDQKIQDMVLSVYSFVQSYPWPQQWLNKQLESYMIDEDCDFANTMWGKILLETIKLRLEGLQVIMEKACSKLQFAMGLEKYLPVFIDDADMLRTLINKFSVALNKNNLNKDNKFNSEKEEAENSEILTNSRWDEIYNFISNIEFSTLPRCGKDADKEIQEEVKKIRDELKAYIKSLKEEAFLLKSAEIIADLKAMHPILKCLTRLILDFSNKYTNKKNQRASVDFNDLEHLCLKILSEVDEEGNIHPTKVANFYKEKYSEILVDEYQDSNLVQEILIKMISREDIGTPNVFMVGDVKQSIYRFRQAKPELFLEKYNNYSDAENSLYRKILLFKNFRSRKEVIDGVNFVFKQIMSESIGELDYSDIEKLNPGASYTENFDESRKVGGEVELHLIETVDRDNEINFEHSDNESYGEETEIDEKLDEDEILDNLQQEARMVANRIVELLKPDKNGKKFSVLDKKTNEYRDLQFKDIVILLRTTKNWTDIFSEELSKSGIPTFSDTGSGFFKTPEVQVVLSLLQIIDNPYQDIPLLSVLRSPIGNFSTNDLAELRLADKRSSLFEALKILALQENKTSGNSNFENANTSSEKAKRFLDNLAKWRDMSLYMSTHKLIWQLYDDTAYFSIVGAMQDGEKKQANLRVLFERALQFENTSYKGLFNFINFIDKLKTNKGDLGSAKILGENDNVVRLMSIHKSKGLEFPVVFLCGCGKKFNFQDMYKGILLHQELGFGPDYVDYKKRIKYPSVPKLAIAEKLKKETLSEEMRILYVGMTRAREKLILTGAVNNLERSANKWLSVSLNNTEKFPAHDMMKAQNYLDWICPCAMRHINSDKLRKVAGIGKELGQFRINDQSVWEIFLYNKKHVAVPNIVEQESTIKTDAIDWLKSNTSEIRCREELVRRLDWKYKYKNFASIPSKISVTEIKRFFNINNEGEDAPINREVGIKKPLFLQEKKGLSSAEKGTTMHFVMQHLDFYDNNIQNQINNMVQKELITDKQAKSVNVNKIKAFISSPICQRMLLSGNFFREVPFNIELPFEELYPAADTELITDDNILLQGVIDCYFEEDNKIILIDYKTDYIKKGEIENIKRKYGIQISYYTKALELLTGLSVSERYIYLFSVGEFVEM